MLERICGVDVGHKAAELLEHWLRTERRREYVRPGCAADIEENGREHARDCAPRCLPRQSWPKTPRNGGASISACIDARKMGHHPRGGQTPDVTNRKSQKMSQPETHPVVACTLSDADLASQGARWEQLCRDAELERAFTDDGIKLIFRNAPAIESELRSLVAVESECCAWANWSVSNNGSDLVLGVSSTGDGVMTLHAMFDKHAQAD